MGTFHRHGDVSFVSIQAMHRDMLKEIWVQTIETPHFWQLFYLNKIKISYIIIKDTYQKENIWRV